MHRFFNETENKTVGYIIKVLIIKLIYLYPAGVLINLTAFNARRSEFFHLMGDQVMVEIFQWPQ